MTFVSAVQGIRDEIASRLNEVESDNTDRYTNYVNLGLRDIHNTFWDSPVLQLSADRTLSSGTRIYALPSDFEKMNGVTYPAGDVKLKFIYPEIFDQLQPSASEGGVPTVYTIRGQSVSSYIEYYPSPGGSYTVHYDYQRTIPTVSAGSATPQIPEKWNELLILYGESSGLRKRGRYNDARDVKEEYESLKQKMIDDLRNRVTENDYIKHPREFGVAGASNDPIVNLFHRNS